VCSLPFFSTFVKWTTLARLDFGIVLVFRSVLSSASKLGRKGVVGLDGSDIKMCEKTSLSKIFWQIEGGERPARLVLAGLDECFEIASDGEDDGLDTYFAISLGFMGYRGDVGVYGLCAACILYCFELEL
jgi:hypothetical protein